MSEIWAKSNGTPLKEHVKDILECINYLPFDKIKINIDKELFEKLLKFLALFHDIGKASPYFQKEIGNQNFPLKNPDFPPLRHNILSLFFINKEKIKEICNNDEGIYATFLSAIAFHHWKIDERDYLLYLNPDLKNTARKLLENSLGNQIVGILKDHFKGFTIDNQIIEDFISFDYHLAKHIEKEGNLISANIIPPYSLYFLPQKLIMEKELKIDLNLWIFLAGFLMRVDHFASFMEKEGTVNPKDFEIKPSVENLSDKLKKNFGEDYWQKIVKDKDKKNLILIAPTGIGKTEAAFLWAEGEKFFYTLPYRVATNQIFERTCKYFNTSDDNSDIFIKGNVGLLHSDADLYLIEKLEISKKTFWDGENLKILELSRHFSLPISIVTGDQIFPAALKYPTYEKIYATLGYSKIIIDEVQSYDPRACAIIIKMIEEMIDCGARFLLMTATLPPFIIKKLLKEIIIKKLEEFFEIIDCCQKISEIIDCCQKISEIIDCCQKISEIIDCCQKISEIIDCCQKISDIKRHKIIKKLEESFEIIDYYQKISDIKRHKIKLIKKDIEEDNTIEEIINKANKGKRILVVLNTVEKAENVYKKIIEKINSNILVELIHSRFTLNERKEKEEKLTREFCNPKREDEKTPKILIATQVIEVSLDIDADYLFTEIAPIDVLVQRMGRVMRRVNLIDGKIKNTGKNFNYTDFYENNEENILIYYTEDNEKIRESGKGKVYEQKLIEKTYKVLREKGEIGEKEKQSLVEEVYNEEELKDSEYLKKFYDTLKILEKGFISENKEEAHQIFREIYSIPVIIIEDDKDKKINEIVDKINNTSSINWLWFKKEIIAQYVINDNMNRYREKEINSLWNEIKEELKLNKKEKDKIRNYCEGIFVYKKTKQVYETYGLF
ncbi:MAG: CRISPR-associated helicase Cas3' [candidate division WOR-3 bacterium]